MIARHEIRQKLFLRCEAVPLDASPVRINNNDYLSHPISQLESAGERFPRRVVGMKSNGKIRCGEAE